MKTLKCLLFIVCAFITFSSCEKRNVTQGREAYKRFYNNYLPNPKSLKVLKESYTIGKRDEVKWILEIETENVYGDLMTVHDSIITTGNRYFMFNDMVMYDDGRTYNRR